MTTIMWCCWRRWLRSLISFVSISEMIITNEIKWNVTFIIFIFKVNHNQIFNFFSSFSFSFRLAMLSFKIVIITLCYFKFIRQLEVSIFDSWSFKIDLLSLQFNFNIIDRGFSILICWLNNFIAWSVGRVASNSISHQQEEARR